jgi:hypothetical protein
VSGAWRPVIVHADGSDCDHTGDALSSLGEPDGPVCAGGQQVTHVRFNGQTLTIEDAARVVWDAATAIADGLKPFVAALAEMGRALAPTGSGGAGES